ncbi:unnamed protein product [Leptidea sinapis]|uniref:Uncharacterized protein n=1 Tax=Leptidea sinapis TaxID=189913 RepID=A0A5E4QPF8_9NEOP|nr:unnamed protein product [Leptidea sinapis]
MRIYSILCNVVQNCPMPIKIFRIGKFVSGKHRKIKVCFENLPKHFFVIRLNSRKTLRSTLNKHDCQVKFGKEIKMSFRSDLRRGSVSKSIVNRNLICLNEDTLGAIVKGGIAQYVAMELAQEQRSGRQERAQNRHLVPPPGSREVTECVGRVRVVSWLVLGALVNARDSQTLHQPLPLDATCNLTDHLQVI